ncbi:hypothetical protein FM107_07635 [Sphingobacterium sp. JB170]|nr:hypothetical protein FM107_07635 [Sphingobacterium sp. JB170]
MGTKQGYLVERCDRSSLPIFLNGSEALNGAFFVGISFQ